MKLSDLVQSLPDCEAVIPHDADITRVDFDSRQVRKGSLFVAMVGERADGHRFVGQAFEQGAEAVVVARIIPELADRNYLRFTDTRAALALLAGELTGHPDRQMDLVAVTGTNGKTTTVTLISEAFSRVYGVSGTIGTLGGQIGQKRLPHERTTPEAPDLFDILSSMKAQGCQAAAMEVSSHAIKLKRVYGMRFAAAVFTNLSQDHLDFHGDLESYFQAKAELFESYDAGKAVINADDPYGRRLIQTAAMPVLTYGFDKGADVSVASVSLERNGTTIEAATPRGGLAFRSPLISTFNVYNVMAALAVCEALQLPQADFIEAVSQFKGVPGRMECFDLGGRWVYVDYSHTPEALELAIRELQKLFKGDVHVLFGCGGNRDREKRPLMGQIAEQYADKVYITNDNPRDEEPEDIADMIMAGMQYPQRAILNLDRKAAIRQALGELPDGCALLIAGKGHETYQEIKGTKFPFDDRVEVNTYSSSLKS